jgi:hypothetical protein
MVISPVNSSTYSVAKTRDTPQGRAKSRSRSRRKSLKPKQVLHTASCYSPYISEYVGNQQPTTYVASASHSQASWAQLLPPPPPRAPAPIHNQQPEGHHQVQQKCDLREESKARTVNNTVPESRHIY